MSIPLLGYAYITPSSGTGHTLFSSWSYFSRLIQAQVTHLSRVCYATMTPLSHLGQALVISLSRLDCVYITLGQFRSGQSSSGQVGFVWLCSFTLGQVTCGKVRSGYIRLGQFGQVRNILFFYVFSLALVILGYDNVTAASRLGHAQVLQSRFYHAQIDPWSGLNHTFVTSSSSFFRVFTLVFNLFHAFAMPWSRLSHTLVSFVTSVSSFCYELVKSLSLITRLFFTHFSLQRYGFPCLSNAQVTSSPGHFHVLSHLGHLFVTPWSHFGVALAMFWLRLGCYLVTTWLHTVTPSRFGHVSVTPWSSPFHALITVMSLQVSLGQDPSGQVKWVWCGYFFILCQGRLSYVWCVQVRLGQVRLF